LIEETCVTVSNVKPLASIYWGGKRYAYYPSRKGAGGKLKKGKPWKKGSEQECSVNPVPTKAPHRGAGPSDLYEKGEKHQKKTKRRDTKKNAANECC